jgi:N-acetylglucosamine kinase-like BadF-type ATPase
VVCGTGINAIGRRADGTTARFLAVGRISGDWGGGTWLGEEAHWHAVRGQDRRGPATALAALIAAHLGYREIDEVTLALHLGRLPHSSLATLSPLVFQAAAAGDAVARRIVERQAEEIALMAYSVISRLELLAEPVPVVLGGGVITAGHPALLDGVRGRLAELAPNAEPVEVTAPPLLGAALLALTDSGAEPAVLDRVADEFRLAVSSPLRR